MDEVTRCTLVSGLATATAFLLSFFLSALALAGAAAVEADFDFPMMSISDPSERGVKRLDEGDGR